MGKPSILGMSMMQTVVAKAIQDLKRGGVRETRNALELCQSVIQTAESNMYWTKLTGYIFHENNQYRSLLHRMAISVREETLKVIGINLGYMAFLNGSEIFRTQYPKKEAPCWIQKIQVSEISSKDIHRWNQRGVFVFYEEVDFQRETAGALFAIAAHNLRSIFICVCKEKNIDVDWLKEVWAFDNVCFLFSPDVIDKMGKFFQEKKLFFGVYRRYKDIRNLQEEKRNLENWIRCGSLCCIYDTEQRGERWDDFYHILRNVRQKGVLEILLYDSVQDSNAIQEMMLEGAKRI